ncbi:hypothetical protein KR200_003216, partial [Drosophila serrata]
VDAAYDLRIERLNKVEGDPETLIEFNWRVIGREHLLNGTIVNHVDFDDTFEIVASVEAFMNGEWKPLAINGRFGICAFFDSLYPKYFLSSFKDSNMPKSRGTCPFKKGEYYMRNIYMQTENWAAYARMGRNKMKFIIMKNNITYGGFIGVAILKDRTF